MSDQDHPRAGFSAASARDRAPAATCDASNSMSRRRLIAGLGGGALLSTAPGWAQTQGFPNRPITLIVPFPAGGVTDVHFRGLAQIASKDLGPIVISNRPGATGTLGPGQMATTAAPDGYTLSVVPAGVFRQPHIAKVPWDPLKDFTWILGVTAYSFGVAVRADAPWKSFQELIDFAKANPDKLTIGTSGRGNAGHVAMEKVSRLSGAKMTQVTFKGAAEFMAALVGGHIDVVPDGGWGTMARAGRVRVLAMMTPRRLPSWPDVPTFKQLGYDVEVLPMLLIAGPKGMDPAVVKTLHDAFRKAAFDPAFQKVLDSDDQAVLYMDAAACAKYGQERFEEERRIVAEFGLAQPQ